MQYLINAFNLFVLLIATSGLNGISLNNLSGSEVLAQTVKDVIRNFYGVRHACLYVLQKNGNENSLTAEIVDAVLHQKEDLEVTFKLQNIKYINIPGPKKVYNLIFVDSYESFTHIYQIMNPDSFEYQGFYLIVLTQLTINHYSIVRRMLEDFWRNYIINVNVILLNPTQLDESFVYTYFPYSNNICGVVRPIILKRFNLTSSDVDDSTDYFPEKVSNMFNCPLTVAIFETKPFMMITRKDDGQVEIDGVDAKVLNYISAKLNFKPILKVSDVPWGLALDNGTMTDAIKMVYDLEANLTLGYFFKSHDRDRVMTASWNYHTSKSYWIVPPGKPYTSFEKLFKPFKNRLWTAVALAFILSNVLICIFNRIFVHYWKFIFGDRADCPYYDNFTITFGGVIPIEPAKNFARIIFIFYVFYWLIVRSAYQGALFQFLQKDSTKPHLKNTKEMIENDFTFYINKVGIEIFEYQPEIMKR